MRHATVTGPLHGAYTVAFGSGDPVTVPVADARAAARRLRTPDAPVQATVAHGALAAALDVLWGRMRAATLGVHAA